MAGTIQTVQFFAPVDHLDFVDLNTSVYVGSLTGPVNIQAETAVLGGLLLVGGFTAANACLFDVLAAELALTTSTQDPPFPPTYPYLFSTDVIYGRDHMTSNRNMTRGDRYDFGIAVTLNGDPYDLTAASLRMTAKWDVTDADGAAVFSITSADDIAITDPTNGLATVSILPAKTASLPAHKVDLVYDIQLYVSATQKWTIMQGTLSVRPDVSVTAP